MNAEQQMKEALDGKFFYFTPEGKVACRDVSPRFVPTHGFDYLYSKESASKGGMAAGGDKKKNRITWSDGQTEWLRKNMGRKTVNQCARALNIAYHRVYDKILRLKREARQ